MDKLLYLTNDVQSAQYQIATQAHARLITRYNQGEIQFVGILMKRCCVLHS